MPLLHRPVMLPFDRGRFMAWFAGSEGGLATTTAIIAGLMVIHTGLDVIVVTAIISFMVQGFNGSIGLFAAERTDDEINREDRMSGYRKPAVNALLHFMSHVLMSVLVLLPILLVPNQFKATTYSIVITLVLLFGIGAYKGKIVKRNPIRDGLELVVLGSLVISVGIVAGTILGE